MASPLFTVLPPRSRGIQVTTPFALHRDAWDDFGFKTQYQLTRIDDAGGKLLGSLKILKRGQTTSSRGLLEEGPLDALAPDFCSVGQSLDYYERIAALGPDLGARLLFALRDVISNPGHGQGFETEPGWSTSLWRDTEETEFRKLASVLLHQRYSGLPDIGLDLSFTMTGWHAPLSLHVEAPDEDHFLPRGGQFRSKRLPRRVVVLTGRNGSGKSTLLARLARVLHASQSDRARPTLLRLGLLTPPGIGFTRIITISYSAFDAFQVPGLTRSERRQIATDIESGVGRFVFCGLRDIAKELLEELGESPQTDETQPFEELEDRQRRTLLKTIEQLADEFGRTIDRLRDRGRFPIFERAAAMLLTDPSFGSDETSSLSSLLGADPIESFLNWSTGHKIVLHSLAALAAFVEPKSILLFDEPESHLHPPLLASLMHGTREILEEFDAFGVVATHSPVVAQETLSRHVNVVRRQGTETTIVRPSIETFAESIGEITNEVFGLNSDATDYHNILEELTRTRQTLEEVESLFDHGLSLQARAYVMSLFARRGTTR